MKPAASSKQMPLPYGQNDSPSSSPESPDLEEAMFILAGAIEIIKDAISFNLQRGGRYSLVLSQEDLVKAVENIKTISKAPEGTVKDVLGNGKRGYQLKGLSFLRRQNSLPVEQKHKYMSMSEINRLAALLVSLDKMRNKHLLEETISPISWLMNLSDTLDKYGELEKADALDKAASILVSASQIDNVTKTSDLILDAIHKLKPRELKEFLQDLPPERKQELDDIIFSYKDNDLSVEDEADLMSAWQELYANDKKDNVTQKYQVSMPPTVDDVMDMNNREFRKYLLPKLKLNQRMFNLLCFAANSLDEQGRIVEAEQIDAALKTLASLAREFE